MKIPAAGYEEFFITNSSTRKNILRHIIEDAIDFAINERLGECDWCFPYAGDNVPKHFENFLTDKGVKIMVWYTLTTEIIELPFSAFIAY